MFFLSLGLLRLIQDKMPAPRVGRASWIAYLIVVVFCALVAVIALWRIKKTEKELN